MSLSAEKRDRYTSLNGVGELVENVGPCPRDILRYIRDPEGFNEQLHRSVNGLGVETITKFFRNIQRSSNDPLSEKIVLLERRGNPTCPKDDPYFIRFKSWKIRGLVHDHFSVLRLEQAIQLFDATKRSADSSTVAAGFAFEWLANVSISGKDQLVPTKQKVFWQFAPMVAIKAKATKAGKYSGASAEPNISLLSALFI